MERTGSAIEDVAHHSEAAARRARSLENGMGNLEKRSKSLGDRLSRLGAIWRGFTVAMKPAIILGMATAFSAAVQAVGALAGGVIALLPRLGDMTGALAPMIAGVTGLGLAMVTTKLAFGGLSQAMGGDMRSWRQLAPEAKRFVVTLRGWRGEMRQLRASASSGIFAGLTDALKTLRPAMPVINNLLADMSKALGGLASQAARRLTTGRALGDVSTIGEQGVRMVQSLGRSLLNLADWARNVAVAARPFTDWLTNVIEQWTKFLAVRSEERRNSGALAQTFQRTQRALEGMGHIIGNLWRGFSALFRAARPLGELLWRDAERATGAWAKMLGSEGEQVRLTSMFLRMEPGIRAIARLLGALGGAIFRMGSQQGFVRLVDSLTAAVPSLEHLMNTLSNTFSGSMGGAIQAIAGALDRITSSGARTALSQVFSVLGGIARAFNTIYDALGPVADVLAQIWVTSRILRWGRTLLGVWKLARNGLRLLAGDWLGVAAAARTAAAAEAAAMGIPVGRGGVGRGVGRGAAGGTSSSGGVVLVPGSPAARAAEAEAGALARGGILSRTRTAYAAGGLRGVGGMARGGITAARAGMSMGRVLGAGRLALGAAGKFLWPIAVLQGLFGGATAQRSGSFGHQAAQTAFGALDASSFGLLGKAGLGNWARTPNQQIQGDREKLQKDLDQASKTHGNIARTAAEIQAVRTHMEAVMGKNDAVWKQYREELQQQIDLLKKSNAEFKEQRTGTRLGKRQQTIEGYYQQAVKQGETGAVAAQDTLRHAVVPQIAAARDPAVRARLEQSSLAALRKKPGSAGAVRDLMSFITQWEQSQSGRGVKPVFGGAEGGIFFGGAGERKRLLGRAQSDFERGRAQKATAPTGVQQRLIDSLMASMMSASGMTRAEATREARGLVLLLETNPGLALRAIRGLAPSRRQKRAAGGRVPGNGLSDTVPIGPGAMAAPGELVVNRHTEARVNSMLSGTTLGGEVSREGRPHGAPMRAGRGKFGVESFATGARVSGGDPVGIARVVALGRKLQGMGYTVGEQSSFGGVFPVHAGNSYHYADQAIDVNADNMAGGEQVNLDKLYRSLSAQAGALHLSQLIWRSKGHWDHLHAAMLPAVGGRGTYFPSAEGLTGGGNAGAIDVAAAAATAGAAAPGGAVPPAATTPGTNIADVLNRVSGEAALAGIAGLAAISGAPEAAAAVAAAGGGVTATPAAGGTPVAIGQSLAAGYGWGSGNQWNALDKLWTGESNWNPEAVNPSSKAGGIPQALPASKMGQAAVPKALGGQGSAGAQVRWGLNYIKGRYGTPANAYSSWLGRDPHWYKGGGRVRWGGWHQGGLNTTFSTPTLIGVGEKGREHVNVSPAGKGGGGRAVTINATFNINGGNPEHVRREIEGALSDFADALDQHPYDGVGGDVT